MKLSRLQPFREPPPPERQSCVACRTFVPECLVPHGDAALPMCWLCAHHVIEHNVAIEHAYCAECECTPEEIFPDRAPRVLEPRPTSTQRRLSRFDNAEGSGPVDTRGLGAVAAVAEGRSRRQTPEGE